MDTMTEDENNNVEIKCIFCEKELEQHEMVRYKGAISCRECAEKQEPISKLRSKPLFYLAGIGCLVGIVNFVYFTFHLLVFMPVEGIDYIQPLVPYLAAMTITLILVSFGLYAVNSMHLPKVGIISMLTALLMGSTYALALYDFVTDGPYYVIESITYTKTLTYYPNLLASYSLFAMIAAIGILLHMSNFKTENVSIASASFLLISAVMVMFPVQIVINGFIHAFTWAVTFVFFVTRKQIIEEEPIKPL